MDPEQALLELSRTPEGRDVIASSLQQHMCPIKIPSGEEFYYNLDADLIDLWVRVVAEYRISEDMVRLMFDRTELIPLLLRPTIKYDRESSLRELRAMACLACLGNDAVSMKALIDRGHKVRPIDLLDVTLRLDSELLPMMVDQICIPDVCNPVYKDARNRRVFLILLEHPDVHPDIKAKITAGIHQSS